MSYNPKVYNTVIQSGITGAGTYNLAPIAYGLISNGVLSKSYNVDSTPTITGGLTTITITYPPTNGNYIPIVTLTSLAYNQAVPIIETNSTTANTITFKSYYLRSSSYNQIIDANPWNFYFVIYGN